MKTELCNIMSKHGSDKGQGPHNYTIFYNEIFKNKKNEKLNIFELGLGTNNLDVKSNMGLNGKPGASLRGWKEYFTNASIYGADIDSRILFEEDGIKTFYCDQTDKEVIKSMWENKYLSNISFDIIIEDGLHEFYANLVFLENSLHKLKIGGYYIVEDLLPETINQFESVLNDLKLKFPNHTFNILQIEHKGNTYGDNNLLVINKLT